MRSGQDPARTHAVRLRDAEVVHAHRHQQVPRVPGDDVGLGRRRALLPEAELADQAESLGVGEPRSVAVLVLDDASPERDPSEHRRASRTPEVIELPGRVEPAAAVGVGSLVRPRQPAGRLSDLTGTPRPRPGRDRAQQQSLAVPPARERPRAPGEDRLDLDLDGEAADDRDGGSSSWGSSLGPAREPAQVRAPAQVRVRAAGRPRVPGWARARAPAAMPARSRSPAWEGRCPRLSSPGGVPFPVSSTRLGRERTPTGLFRARAFRATSRRAPSGRSPRSR